MSTDNRDWDAELAAAVEADNASDSAAEQSFAQPATGTPAGEPAPQVQPEPVEPVPGEPSVNDAQAPVEPAAHEDTFDGGEFNPDLLPAELQPGWRQLQGAYTRKTQELAQERRQLDAQLAQLGDPELVNEAFGLYTAIQNPENWVKLHEELTAAMREAGLLEGDTPAAPVAPQPSLPDLEGLSDDPELAPLLGTVNALQQRLDQYEAREREQAMIRQAEYEHAQRVAEFEAQEARIRDLNPHYKDEDWNEIYALTPFYGGNLVAAQQHFEQRERARIERYLSSKQSAQGSAPSMPTGQPAASTTVEQPETILDVGEWAVEHIRALQNAGELDI